MGLLSAIYKHGLWLSWPFFVVGLYILLFSIVTVVRLGNKNLICSLPLKAEQVVRFEQADRVVLCLEGPQFTTRFRGLSFELTGPDGAPVPGRRSLFRPHSSGFSRSRLTYRVYTVPEAGQYALVTKGLGAAQPADEEHRLLLMRPHLLEGVVCVLGIILGAGLVIGSLVNFFLRLTQVR